LAPATYFSVDPVTGDIDTAALLDRETTAV
jgi:hypothetical protein